MFGTIGTVESAGKLLADQERAVEKLRAYCGRLPVEACGQRRCGYFDEEQSRCALLVWNVYSRLGEDAFRWFATHRTPKVVEVEPSGEALAMRVGML
ncbi:MAG TPA: hypothetical protein VGW79_05775 [Actinomycetota bacterium]|nr:hypothetical protein [Actinomycetota bacterium]